MNDGTRGAAGKARTVRKYGARLIQTKLASEKCLSITKGMTKSAQNSNRTVESLQHEGTLIF